MTPGGCTAGPVTLAEKMVIARCYLHAESQGNTQNCSASFMTGYRKWSLASSNSPCATAICLKVVMRLTRSTRRRGKAFGSRSTLSIWSCPKSDSSGIRRFNEVHDVSVAEDHVLEAKAIMVETYGKDLASYGSQCPHTVEEGSRGVLSVR